MPEVEAIARQNCEKYGSRFHKTNDMKEAFRDADIVYPKSWAPFAAMEERTKLYAKGDQAASMRWRRSCWLRTPSIRTGPAPRR